MQWKGPDIGWLKANWDVALNIERKRVGIGVVIKDTTGRVYTALSRSVEACPAPVIAEAMGALQALEFCQDLGIT